MDGTMKHTPPIQRLLALALLLAMTGCTTTSGHAPIVQRSGFDGSRVIDIDPHGGICRIATTCVNLGAQWSSTHPDRAFLRIQLSGAEYLGIQSALLNIDGSVVDLQPGATPTDYDNPSGVLRESTQTFAVPLDVVRRITMAHRVWVRVGTTSGTVDGAVIDDSRDSKAYNALKRFIDQVDQKQAP